MILKFFFFILFFLSLFNLIPINYKGKKKKFLLPLLLSNISKSFYPLWLATVWIGQWTKTTIKICSRLNLSFFFFFFENFLTAASIFGTDNIDRWTKKQQLSSWKLLLINNIVRSKIFKLEKKKSTLILLIIIYNHSSL